MSWEEDQEWEMQWHGNCANSFWEETKQIVYAKKMGLAAQNKAGKYPVYDLKGASVLDVGGGPYSILLKCINFHGTVLDPCNYPDWTVDRYVDCHIGLIRQPAENFVTDYVFDEVWIYNCLQHTISPEKIITNVRKYAKIIRVFEWIDMGITNGHSYILTEMQLNKWVGGEGKTEELSENGCFGKAYYGIFKGDKYEISPS